MRSQEPGGLRVVSYNVHGLRHDRDAVVAVVRQLSPDVLVVQEAPRGLRWRHRCAWLAHATDLVVAVGGLPALGNLILTDLRVAVKQTWTVRFPLTPGRHMRGAAFLRGVVAGAPFVVAGSHFGTDAAERPAHARLLADACAEVDDPAVLAADLNDAPGGPAWQALPESLGDTATAAGWTASTAPATYPAREPVRRIDAVFAGPQWTVKRHQVVDSPKARRASDHLPVVTDLRLAGA